MSRTLLVTKTDGKELKITIPDDVRITFGPWSPPNSKDNYDRAGRSLAGTLRIYQGATKATESILAVISEVEGFRDIDAIDYLEKVTVEKGATMWESDQHGFVREEKVTRDEQWEPREALPSKAASAPKRSRKPRAKAVPKKA
jgi:hypothetical protein